MAAVVEMAGKDAAITQRDGDTLLSAEINEPPRPGGLLARQAQGINHGERIATFHPWRSRSLTIVREPRNQGAETALSAC